MFDYYCFRFDLFPFIYEKQFFGKPKYMMFEDLLAPVPGMIVDYLKEHYGENIVVEQVGEMVDIPIWRFKDNQ